MTLSVGTGWREPLHPFPSFSMDPFRDNVLGSFKWFCWQSKHFHLRISWIVVSVLLVLDLRWHVKKMCFLWRPVTEHDQTVLRPTEQESDILEVSPGKQTFKLACAQHAFTRCAFFILHIRNAFAIASTPRTARREFGRGNSQIWLFCAFALAGTRSADHHFREHGRGLSLLWNGTSVALTQKILEHRTYWQFSGYWLSFKVQLCNVDVLWKQQDLHRKHPKSSSLNVDGALTGSNPQSLSSWLVPLLDRSIQTLEAAKAAKIKVANVHAGLSVPRSSCHGVLDSVWPFALCDWSRTSCRM